jgi:predicted RNA binding protein YcfA (HicA-like mRNA interferase family)
MNGKQVIAKLKAGGWTLRRINGSHHIMTDVDGARSVPVPVHGNRDLPAGTLAAIARVSGIKLN